MPHESGQVAHPMLVPHGLCSHRPTVDTAAGSRRRAVASVRANDTPRKPARELELAFEKVLQPVTTNSETTPGRHSTRLRSESFAISAGSGFPGSFQALEPGKSWLTRKEKKGNFLACQPALPGL